MDATLVHRTLVPGRNANVWNSCFWTQRKASVWNTCPWTQGQCMEYLSLDARPVYGTLVPGRKASVWNTCPWTQGQCIEHLSLDARPVYETLVPGRNARPVYGTLVPRRNANLSNTCPRTQGQCMGWTQRKCVEHLSLDATQVCRTLCLSESAGVDLPQTGLLTRATRKPRSM